jgi:hypothetical protein
MKVAVRVLILVLILAFAVAGLMLYREMKSLPDQSTFLATVPNLGSHPILHVLIKLIFSF